jgi:hypothetical protein
MFMLYAVPIGLLLGLLLGGRPEGLSALRFRWGAVALLGFAVQIALFSEPVSERIGSAGPAVYVASTLAVLVAVCRNVPAIRGLALVALGAASNLTAIVANGGFMPAAPGALAALGKSAPAGYSNSTVLAAPVLEPLTDLFALPRWMPFANVFSIGDVLIGLGVGLVIVVAMRGARSRPVGTPVSASAASSVQPGNSPT